MHLKSLTLKGFKSFADSTTLELEPGVTVVVGPNGSGKSNVVDAVAWVLGAQGPRVVRSSKMDDVIFAGTASRPPLGRAEVSLVIDNSSHDLPVDFNEVTITRTLFRSGDSEYAINGVPCRLLDVQELLSDSGVGRTQHVIIGQGQIDAILAARPEERRMVIEEAAGILKYRRRRERAVRRLEASESNLMRLQDLLREVRRQMRPLERQATSAQLHEQLDDELHGIRRYLAGTELRTLERNETDAQSRAVSLDARVTSLRSGLDEVELRLDDASDSLAGEPEADLATQSAALERLRERAHGLAALIDERRRSGAALLAALEAAGDVASLEHERVRVVADLEESEQAALGLAPRWDHLAGEEAGLIEAEVAHAERFAGLVRSGDPELASRREEANGARIALEALRRDELMARTRVENLVARVAERRARSGALEQRRSELVASTEGMRRIADSARDERDRLVAAREGEEAHLDSALEALNRLRSREEALDLALSEARARADLERLSGVPGVLGTLRELVSVEPEAAVALEAALAEVLDAAVMDDSGDLALAIARLAGHGGQLVPVRSSTAGPRSLSSAPPHCRWMRSAVDATDPRIRSILDGQLERVLLTDLAVTDALHVVESVPDHIVVTTAGDRISQGAIRLSASSVGATAGALEQVRAEREGTETRAAHAQQSLEQARERERAAGDEEERRRTEADAAAAELGAVAREIAAVDEELRNLANELSGATAESEAAAAEVAPAAMALGWIENELNRLEAESAAMASRFGEADAARRVLDERARALAALRKDLEVRAASLEQRRDLLSSRLHELDAALAEREEARRELAQRRAVHGAEESAMRALTNEITDLSSELNLRAEAVAGERERRQARGRVQLQRLSELRRERDGIERQLAEVNEQRQRLEIEVTEVRIRREAAVDALRRDLEIEPAEALAAPRPELPPGTEPSARARALERQLRELGPVNPLAAEELAALTERGEFLEGQLEDVRRARRELNQVIRAVDAEIVDVFAAAYEDVAANFEALFSSLFPGGEGHLSLTAPDDLLESGVEIEARPAGRNVRRLSLLSGGERALVAMAYLFSVFRARPSPFYLMDEVEAALDEANLLRFHGLVEQFRGEAQLIIVSHQKKTMEVADALYGISMQPGGASKVISEQVRRPTAERPHERELLPSVSWP